MVNSPDGSCVMDCPSRSPGDRARKTWFEPLLRTGGNGIHQVATNLEELVALCEKARLFVGGDTGPMHFAAAAGTPIVSIFGPTSSDRNGPFRREDIVVERRLPCRPCYERDKCPLEHWECIVDITVDQVYEACRKRMSLPKQTA